FAGLVAETPAASIPAGVRAHAALVVADTVGAILGGAAEPEVRRLHTRAERAAGPATVLGPGFPRAEPWWAIVANGTAGTTLELDEGNRFARGHPGIHVFPAALAEAERLGAGGEALLAAFVLGYDVAARLGAAAPVRAGMHMHGVHGPVGAAAAVARLRGFDAGASAAALAVAAGLTLGTSWRTALEGATVRNAYAGVGGASGWLAVDLAEAGFTGLPDMLTETFGRISGAAFDSAAALDGLGRRFEVGRNYFKRYACCRYNHAAIEALEGILAERVLAPERVSAIRVETYAAAATMSAREPAGSLAAKFSIPYALAARLVLGNCGPDAFRPPALGDLRVRALARRVEVVEDPTLNAGLPARRPARVEVRLTEGGVLSREVDTASGEFDRPYPHEALREKFLGLAAPLLGRSGAEAAWTLCLGVEGWKSARELAEGLRALEAAR
ncbi:MAG: MmgE/PrpD family protein, partial [Candidatus Rokubacteria bacterium]|nr:MmgE/PrpD family protein [Candidatus Rokubacteria bacterium]